MNGKPLFAIRGSDGRIQPWPFIALLFGLALSYGPSIFSALTSRSPIQYMPDLLERTWLSFLAMQLLLSVPFLNIHPILFVIPAASFWPLYILSVRPWRALSRRTRRVILSYAVLWVVLAIVAFAAVDPNSLDF